MTFRRGLDDDVRLWVAPSPQEAHDIRGRLEQAGIRAVADREEVRVARSDADRAQDLFRQPVDGNECSHCAVPMVPGYVWVRVGEGGTGLEWGAGLPATRGFLGGGGYQPDEVVTTHVRRAHRCPECTRIVIEPAASMEIEYQFKGTDRYETACLACGEPIPPGASRCPECGWSYDAPAESGPKE
jgi:RNase P subunit RPR2